MDSFEISNSVLHNCDDRGLDCRQKWGSSVNDQSFILTLPVGKVNPQRLIHARH